MKTNKRGVSLIVLVITIIIMIIIAGAIILSLNGSGILGRANTAQKSTNYQSAKEVAIMAKADWDLMSDEQKAENGPQFSDYAQTRLQQAGFPASGIGSYEVTNEGIIYANPKIPSGFVISSISGETKVSEGLVIYEGSATVTSTDSDNNGIIDDQENRNQYVWIPVPDMNEFVRRDGYSDGILQDMVSSRNVHEPSTSASNDLTGEYAEYNKMYNSVAKYGGFYIARYEAGSETERTDTSNGTTTLIASKKNKSPYNYVAWGPSMTSASGDVTYSGKNQGKGAVELSRNVYPESGNTQVVSTLVYGIEWDAAIKFLSDVKNTMTISNSLYIVNSTNMGWYSNNKYSNSSHKTGIDLGTNAVNKVKNIYDMAGNMYEFIMEGYLSGNRAIRGGSFGNWGSGYPASYRANWTPGSLRDNIGFRIALYIK